MESIEKEDAVTRSMKTRLVVLKILEHLNVHNLTSCRLVSSTWNECASKLLRERGETVKIAQEDGLNALPAFKSVVIGSRDPYFPFSRFKLDLSVSDDEYNENVLTIIKVIRSRPKIKKLKLIFDLPLYFCFDPEKVRKNGLDRDKQFPLANLEHLSFVITLFEGFEPGFANIESVMKSQGIRKLGVVFTTFVNLKVVQNLSLYVFRTIFNPSVRLFNLQELMIRLECVDENVLEALIRWNHPLKSLNISVIALSCARAGQQHENSNSTIRKLYELLHQQKNTLQNLSLKFSMNEEDAHNLLSIVGLNRSLVNLQNGERRQPEIFPKLHELLKLSLSARYSSEIGTLWRLQNFDFSQKFPKLNCLYLKNWEVSLQDDIPFLPLENVSYPLIEEVQLPNTRQPEDCLLIPKILIAMPNLHAVSFHFRTEVMEAIYRFAPKTLQKLTLFLSCQYQNLDPILTGIPSLEPAENWTWNHIWTCPAAEYQLRPSLLSLKNLKELVINTEGTYVNITDFTVVHILMQLEQFCQLTVLAHPWEGIVSWRFSETCKNYMQSKIKLKLTQKPRSKRYSLM